MALLGFKDRFVPLIESGAKCHTIRGFRAGIKVGTRLDLYANPRQPSMRLIFRAPCRLVEGIEIWESMVGSHGPAYTAVRINGLDLGTDEKEQLSRADGFRDFEDMARFWDGRLPFEGCIYYWDFERRFIEKRAA